MPLRKSKRFKGKPRVVYAQQTKNKKDGKNYRKGHKNYNTVSVLIKVFFFLKFIFI